MRDVLLIALGGGLGAVSRYGVSVWAATSFTTRFPLGTLLVNLVGCLLLGFLMQISLASHVVHPAARAAIGIGFLGGLTTFSTFGYETFARLQLGEWLLAGANIAANVVLGLLAVWLGAVIGRLLVGGA